ncbi:MAG TPA: hypothetical protein VHG88_00380 [Burkholderiales bacterium]|nr:hypothetical protein [Burkholderiales bacterium]
MADERDPLVSRRYRELGAEEPPPAVDEAILAASRRALGSRRRWYLPLAAAAVAVLAVGVTLHVQREQPDPQELRRDRQGEARQERSAKPMQDSAPARAPAAADAMRESPEQFLERIAELRKHEKHEEADKALADFRQRYPDYRIGQEMLERIERR